MMNKDCFNQGCPFRTNETTNANRCECVACPNRDSHEYVITSNRTLTQQEIRDAQAIVMGRKRDPQEEA